MTGGEDVHVDNNLIYSNTDGLVINNANGSNSTLGYNYVTTATINVIYANATLGISLSCNLGPSLINNTVYQLIGDAIPVEWSQQRHLPPDYREQHSLGGSRLRS